MWLCLVCLHFAACHLAVVPLVTPAANKLIQKISGVFVTCNVQNVVLMVCQRSLNCESAFHYLLALVFKANKTPYCCLKTPKTLIKPHPPVPQALSLMLTLVSGSRAVLVSWMLGVKDASQERYI